MSFQTHKTFVHLQNTIEDIWMKSEISALHLKSFHPMIWDIKYIALYDEQV